MFVGFISWWYSDGWRRVLAGQKEGLAHMVDFFSIPLLLSTLFSPFRQISVGSVSGPIGVKLQALLDRLISRLIGAMVRSMTILAGSFVLLLRLFFGVAVLIGWGLLPLVPIGGAALAVLGS